MSSVSDMVACLCRMADDFHEHDGDNRPNEAQCGSARRKRESLAFQACRIPTNVT